MGIRDRPIAPRSPWQNPYVERLIGTLRRECLDHVRICIIATRGYDFREGQVSQDQDFGLQRHPWPQKANHDAPD
jgi:transposase InsO family protein